jgi:hypothetical protein
MRQVLRTWFLCLAPGGLTGESLDLELGTSCCRCPAPGGYVIQSRSTAGPIL